MPAGLIATVAPGSLAGRVGLQAGDELLSINDHSLRDVIDVRFYSAEEHLALRLRRERCEFTRQAKRQYGEPLGLEFAHPTFDGIRRCANHCEFCFVAQMGPGLRRSLYIKDDDYRYSFLFGNYITLTNLDESDWERIGEQHLSPLYVSVHATAPGLRQRMLGNPSAPAVLPQLRRLAGMGIEFHTQIVLLPGHNDGPHLERSIGDLSSLYPALRSISVVPVGLTRFQRGACRIYDDTEARPILEQVTAWQTQLRKQFGVNLVYLSDEWYLRLGESVPPAEAYDGLDLTENGVGLARQFIDHAPRLTSSTSQTLVTGTLFAPLLRSLVEAPSVEVVPVVNRFFGATVTVAGLLTGQDVIEQLSSRQLGERLILPPAMFGGPDGQSLDEMWPEEVGKALGRDVSFTTVPGCCG